MGMRMLDREMIRALCGGSVADWTPATALVMGTSSGSNKELPALRSETSTIAGVRGFLSRTGHVSSPAHGGVGANSGLRNVHVCFVVPAPLRVAVQSFHGLRLVPCISSLETLSYASPMHVRKRVRVAWPQTEGGERER